MDKLIFTDPATGEKTNFFCLEQTKVNGWNYLLVTEDEEGDTEAYILKETSEEGEESTYTMVEDGVELDAIGKIFAELMDEVDLEF